ncbi:MAG: RidA family protein [Acidobacteriaceae bacterium]|nr:RidA family protein [Acidobacteriaceae bacterium]
MKQIVTTDKAPKAIGPYSQAVKSNGFVFLSGQVPSDPRTGAIVGGSIQQQTERVLENIKGLLEAAGLTLHHVIKATVFLKDISHFADMNQVYAKYFTAQPPARTTVEVARLPRDVQIEIEVIAVEPSA